jgi:cytochrome c oxidase subunit 1
MIDTMPDGADARQLRRWCLLAVLALAVAGLTIIPFLLSKTVLRDPAHAWVHEFGPNGLVVHVVTSFAVWFLAMFAALNVAMMPIDHGGRRRGSELADRTGFIAAATGTVFILIAAFLDRGEATLNDYLPMIIDPFFYAGVGLMALGFLLSALRMLSGLARVTATDIVEVPALIATGLLYAAAVLAGLLAWIQLSGQSLSFDFNHRLVWGSGHILQYVNAGLVLISISILYRRAFEANMTGVSFMKWTGGLLLLCGAAGLAMMGIYPATGATYFPVFTDLQYALGLPVALIIAAALGAIWRRRGALNWGDPAAAGFLTAVFLFGVGAFLGLFVDGSDTRTPAHYHGVIGGLNLALMGLFYSWFLPLLGRQFTRQRWVSAQIYLYAVGQLLFVLGMFAAGDMGEARKSTGSGIALDSGAAVAAAGLRDLGGALAVLGGLLFIVLALRALLKPRA